MKKTIGVIMYVLMISGLMSCGNSKSPESQTEESKVANEEVVDTSDVDTTAVTRSGSESEGFGRCLESGCYCKEFKGRGKTCANCGHAYRRHY